MKKSFSNFKKAMIRYGWKYKIKTTQVIFYKPGYSATFIIEKQNRDDIIRVTVPIPNSKYNYTTLLSSTFLHNYMLQHLENYEIKMN